MSYQGRGGAGVGTGGQPCCLAGTQVTAASTARGPRERLCRAHIALHPSALSQTGKKISFFCSGAGCGGSQRCPGAGPAVPPVPMEKVFYHKHLVNSCRRSPFPARPPGVYSERVNKEKQTFLVLVHTRPGAGRLCLADPRLPDGARGPAGTAPNLAVGQLGSRAGHKTRCEGIFPFPFISFFSPFPFPSAGMLPQEQTQHGQT